MKPLSVEMSGAVGLERRYKAWIEEMLKWAKKHGITLEQAINILFYDHHGDGIESQDLYWAEAATFAARHRGVIDGISEVS